MSETVHVRLQGGPFCGERQRDIKMTELAPMIYVERCRQCGSHWFREPGSHSEAYRRDELDERGWLVYVYADGHLTPGVEREERELVPAGGAPAIRSWMLRR